VGHIQCATKREITHRTRIQDDLPDDDGNIYRTKWYKWCTDGAKREKSAAKTNLCSSFTFFSRTASTLTLRFESHGGPSSL
jgi:hypothetical protein